ncbi:MAG: hypothetical protein CL609_24745 [Anaerolineaceae bacterium]|nr:hypothetical protein [Anaerolineaceae bacterium]
MNLMVNFSSEESPSVKEVGSKAFSLIEMHNNGFPVPPGFVLTIYFFEPWMEIIKTRPEWKAVMNATEETLNQSTTALKTLCLSLSFLPEQNEIIKNGLTLLNYAPNSLFAVRSSSPEEDLEGASFAGEYETTLGVSDNILEDAIRRSFASAFDERVFLYKIEHGVPTENPKIAVIVQQQIASDSAGVAFSVNPINNCYDEAVINANYGLGESVVSGVVEPDLFVVNKLNKQIMESKIGQKEVMFQLKPDGGVTEFKPDFNQDFSITPDQVNQITELLSKIEKIYQYPVDIEWAFSNEKLYLLQVRPITTYLPLPEEMITSPGEQKTLYADSTLIEQGIQKPLSVLGTDFLGYILNEMTRPMEGEVSGMDGGAFTAGGRYYLNLSQTLRMNGIVGPLAPGSIGDESILGILDHIDLGPYLPKKPSRNEMVKKLKGPIKMIPLILPALKALRNPDWILKKYHQALPEQIQKIDQAINDKLSLHQQAVELTAFLNFFFYKYGIPLIFAPQIAMMRIKKIFKDEENIKEHLLGLGISLPGNKTAEMGAAMVELASMDTITSCSSVEEFMKKFEENKLHPEFLMKWKTFVTEFGSRCPREIDVATPRINESPALLYEQLKNMATENVLTFELAKQKREAAYKTLYQIALQKGERHANTFKKLYNTWLTLGGYRETPKHYVIKIVDLYRKRVLRVAESFVKDGRLDDPNQIFDLTIKDIDYALTDLSLDLRSLAVERTALINKINRSHLVARVIDSRGKIFYPPRKEAADGEFAGFPISPGIVQGRVKVFQTANEKKLLPGEILVTRATDPGWTPLFINAGGIILEIGGALQHGAVVAREYGIPCVSGVENATNYLKDGQLVEVDGINGIVRVLDEEKPKSKSPSKAEIKKQHEITSRKESSKSKQSEIQKLLRILPLLIIPFLAIFLVAFGYMIVKLIMGNSLEQATNQLLNLWDISSPYLIASTQIIAVPIVLTVLWKNRKGLKNKLQNLVIKIKK